MRNNDQAELLAMRVCELLNATPTQAAWFTLCEMLGGAALSRRANRRTVTAEQRDKF